MSAAAALTPRLRVLVAILLAAGAFAAGWFAMLPTLDYVVERVQGRGGDRGTLRSGPWTTRLDLARPDTPAPVRAYVAHIGIAAHRAEEALYWNATADSAGRRLDGRHAYEVRFARRPEVADAGFWSLTVYGADSFLVPNPGKRYSVGDRSAKRPPDGPFTIKVSSAAPSADPASWLPSPPEGEFSMTLRMYVPLPQTLADPAHAPMPEVACLDCP